MCNALEALRRSGHMGDQTTPVWATQLIWICRNRCRRCGGGTSQDELRLPGTPRSAYRPYSSCFRPATNRLTWRETIGQSARASLRIKVPQRELRNRVHLKTQLAEMSAGAVTDPVDRGFSNSARVIRPRSRVPVHVAMLTFNNSNYAKISEKQPVPPAEV